MIRVTLYKREYRETGFSIEGIFILVRERLKHDVHIDEYSLDPYISRFQNILKVKKISRRNHVNHVTGDVHFLMLGFSKVNKSLLTIHDFGHLDKLKNQPLRRFIYKQLWFSLPLKRADMVTVVSNYTKQELLRRFRYPESKVRVVYNPIKPVFKFSPKQRVDRRMTILQIGTGKHKNLNNLIEAVKGVDCHLDIIGWPSDEEYIKLKTYGISFTVYKGLSDEEVYERYVACDVLFFASFYEGFGMPIIEAQAIGRPVITSNTGAMKEVAGNTAVLIDPYDPVAIREAIYRLGQDDEYYYEMVQMGLNNTVGYQPDRIAQDYLDVYKELAERKKKVTAVAVHPTHYSDFFFAEMHRAELDFSVYYSRNILKGYPWLKRMNYNFSQQFCKYTFGVDWRLVKQAVFDSKTTFLIYGWHGFNNNVLLFILSLFKRRFFLFTDTFQTDAKRSPVKEFLRSSWLKFVFSKAEKILTTGEVGIVELKKFYSHDKIINFPYCTDIEYFNSEPDFSGFDNEKIFFSSGRLSNAHKGLDIAISALANIKEKGIKFKYYIAGTGPDKEVIEQQIERLGLQNEIVLLGWQELDNLKKYYGQSHVFLHTSHFDPYPNCILEAMASRLVVVASNFAGSAVDRIVDGKNGFLFKANSVEHLTNVLLKVLGMNGQELTAISSEARKTSEKWNVKYNVDIMSEIV